MHAYTRAVSTSQERRNRRHAERDWQADEALVSGLMNKLLDLTEEAQLLLHRQAFNCRAAHDELQGLIDGLDAVAHDYLRPMRAAISETEPGEGADALPGMQRVL